MILHIGADVTVSEDEIVVILDAASAVYNKKYLKAAKQENRLSDSGEVKSYVITKQRGKQAKVYASCVSSGTLMKRTNY